MGAGNEKLKTLILAVVLFMGVACGDTTAPATALDTAQTAVSPSTNVAATPIPAESPSPVAAQNVVTFLNAPLTVHRG